MTPAYIFDIDGTLADITHRLYHIQKEPKDWKRFFADCTHDQPITHMVALCSLLIDYVPVLFVSGRSDEVRRETLEWLHKYKLYGKKLYMRKAGDHKPDHLLKLELLANIRADGYEPVMVFDDRTAVVQAWRKAGIPCAQVADGDF